MRHVHSALCILSLLLSSCQGPKVTVLVNEVKPGMLKGRTVGVGGMVATFAAWPGRPIKPAILTQAEQALQRSLKSSRVYVLPADLTAHASAAAPYDGNMSTSAALDAAVMRFAKAHAGLADYFFMMFLRTDSVSYVKNGGWDTGYARVRGKDSFNPRYSLESWRGLTQHELKVDYLLYDTRTNRVVWRAKTDYADEDVSINRVSVGFRNPTKYAEWMPASPTERLWVPMNAATARTLRK